MSDNNVVCDAATIEFLQLKNIWRAIEAGDERYLELLLSAHVPLRAAPFDSSLMPLHAICKSGFVACADVLLRCIPPAQLCVLISELDMFGMSPLHITSAEGHAQLTSLLLQHGASLEMCSRTAGTPLHAAVRRNRRGIIDVLVASIVADGDVTILDVGLFNPLLSFVDAANMFSTQTCAQRTTKGARHCTMRFIFACETWCSCC